MVVKCIFANRIIVTTVVVAIASACCLTRLVWLIRYSVFSRVVAGPSSIKVTRVVAVEFRKYATHLFVVS